MKTRRAQLIRQAATKEADGAEWRNRLEQWMNTTAPRWLRNRWAWNHYLKNYLAS